MIGRQNSFAAQGPTRDGDRVGSSTTVILKLERFVWILMYLVLATAGSVFAFHDQGAGSCGGCHVTHNSVDGQPVVTADGEWLLRAESPSDLCLTCHAENLGSVFGTDPLSPPPEKGAGNFVFLLEDNLNDSPDGRSEPIPGDAAGHNLFAPGHGLMPDARFAQSPGGTFPAGQLGCTSCHDPHGNANFRMLHADGPIMEGLFTFISPAPLADGLAIEFETESRSNHSAYQAGMSAWCGNCHGRDYHERNRSSEFEHPADRPMAAGSRKKYDDYEGDENPYGGAAATSYLPEVPFEEMTNTVSSTRGPGSGARVMCLSCHRAHASSSPAAGRWDFRVARLQEDGVVSGSYAMPNPYPSPNQGPLCQKCHSYRREPWWITGAESDTGSFPER